MDFVGNAVMAAVSAIVRLRYGEEGQGLAEYGLILALVAVVAVAAVTLLGTNITSQVNSIASSI